jgi:ribosomal protein L29
MMTGYNTIRKMSDEELTEYFMKFAKHYFFKGCIEQLDSDGLLKPDRINEILVKEIGEHSNTI